MIKPAKCYMSEVMERFYPSQEAKPGFKPRWDKCHNIFFGRGEMSVWTGFNGHGKSLFLSQVMLDAMAAQEKVCIASYEMTPGRTLQRMVVQATANKRPEEYEIADCLEQWDDTLKIHGHMGQIKAERIIKLFTEEADNGVTQFVIDSLMKCGLDEDDYNSQKRVADWLQSFAQQKMVHVHLVAHPRKGMNEHEIPGKMDVRGTGSITDMADNVLTVWRNKEKADLLEIYESGDKLPNNKDIFTVKAMYDAILYCSKSRDEPEAEGKYGLYYQWGTMQYHDKQDEAPYRYYREG